MIEADILKLSSIPWAAKLINDGRWTPTLSSNRFPKPTGEDSFFAETLDTGRTIRTMLTLRPTEKQDGDMVYKELLVILDLGDGLNGYPHVLHGGFAATLLDEGCGGLIQLNVFEKVKRLGSQHAMNYLTACRRYATDLNTVYKKPIPVPGPVLCTVTIERQDGRKLYVRATIEDGEGTVYTTADCMFVEIRPKL
ncbi:thioesterase superfamily protein [Stagonosporopsis vannaccii]|nr:thioesterase superfamily protein [Stagonosporopsis vannaccii]